MTECLNFYHWTFHRWDLSRN